MNVYRIIKWVVIGTVGVGSVIIIYNIKKECSATPIEHMKSIGEVKNLCVYPLSGGNRTNFWETECTQLGLRAKIDGFRWTDKSFVVYHRDTLKHQTVSNYSRLSSICMVPVVGGMIGLIQYTRRLIIHPPKLIDENRLTITATVVQYAQRRRREINCWDCGDEAARFIATALQGNTKELRLGYIDEETTKALEMDTVGFNIIEPFHDLNNIVHLVTFNWLKEFQANVNQVRIVDDLWRPNIYIKFGFADKTFFRTKINEHDIKWIRIGDAIFEWGEVCTCHVASDDQITRTTVERLRIERDDIPFQPRHLHLLKPGRIQLNDLVKLPTILPESTIPFFAGKYTKV